MSDRLRLRCPVLHRAARTAALGFAVLVVGQGRCSAAADEEVMQMIADAAVIDAECQTTNTMYGVVFRYGEAHGIETVDILPTGRRRREFEALFKRRLTATSPGEICGSIQASYLQAFPDWFRPR